MRTCGFLSTLLFSITMNAAAASSPESHFEEANLYPYVVPEDSYYPGGVANREAAGIATKLGHGLVSDLAYDDGGLVHNVSPGELEQAHLTGAQARAVALRNLKTAVSSGTVSARVFKAGPQGRPFILFSDHWLSAACILLPDLYDLASKQLDTTDILVSVPNRGAMLVFSKGDAAYRNAMRALVRDKESNESKPLTFRLFGLTKTGPVEDDAE